MNIKRQIRSNAHVITAGKSKHSVSIPSSTSLSTVTVCFSLSSTTFNKQLSNHRSIFLHVLKNEISLLASVPFYVELFAEESLPKSEYPQTP